MPVASVARMVTTCVPVIEVVAAGVCILVGLAVQLSLAVVAATYDGKVAAQLALAATLVLAGQVIKGAVASTAVTMVAQVAELPAASVAVSTTEVFPSDNSVPPAGLWVMVGFAVQLSLAVPVRTPKKA